MSEKVLVQPDADFRDAFFAARSLLNKKKLVEAEAAFKKLASEYPKNQAANYFHGHALHGLKRYDDARKAFVAATESPSFRGHSLYNIACGYSIQERIDEGLMALGKAIQAGFKNVAQMTSDPDLANLRPDARFQELVDGIAAERKTTSLADYGVSAQFPFGRPHPQAPKELQQFDFMVGNFDRKERSLQKDGTWGPWTKGEWNARYFMNGHAIIDESLNHLTGVTTSNLRFFDEKTKTWKVSWFTEPNHGTTHAEGRQVGDEMVITDKKSGARYVFHNITKDGYDWELRSLKDGQWVGTWQIALTRRK